MARSRSRVISLVVLDAAGQPAAGFDLPGNPPENCALAAACKALGAHFGYDALVLEAPVKLRRGASAGGLPPEHAVVFHGIRMTAGMTVIFDPAGALPLERNLWLDSTLLTIVSRTQVSPARLRLLREREISYTFADSHLDDYAPGLISLRSDFGLRRLLLCGEGLCAYCVRNGMADELHVLMATTQKGQATAAARAFLERELAMGAPLEERELSAGISIASCRLRRA